MVKETKRYTTSDGKEYNTKKAAHRHENELVFTDLNKSHKEIRSLLHRCKARVPVLHNLLRDFSDWRDMPQHLVKQLRPYVDDILNDIVTYQLIEVKRSWHDSEKVNILESVKTTRLANGESPKEFQKRVNKKQEWDKNGSTFTLELHYDTKYKKQYVIREHLLAPEEKLTQGYELHQDEIRELVYTMPRIHQEEGEDGRWHRAMVTVIDVNGQAYAVHWDKALTEHQQDQAFEQPKKVEVKEKEVTIIKKEIHYLEE